MFDKIQQIGLKLTPFLRNHNILLGIPAKNHKSDNPVK